MLPLILEILISRFQEGWCATTQTLPETLMLYALGFFPESDLCGALSASSLNCFSQRGNLPEGFGYARLGSPELSLWYKMPYNGYDINVRKD